MQWYWKEHFTSQWVPNFIKKISLENLDQQNTFWKTFELTKDTKNISLCERNIYLFQGKKKTFSIFQGNIFLFFPETGKNISSFPFLEIIWINKIYEKKNPCARYLTRDSHEDKVGHQSVHAAVGHHEKHEHHETGHPHQGPDLRPHGVRARYLWYLTSLCSYF